MEWDKTYGGDHWDELYDVAEAPDGGYLLGGTSSSSVSGDKTEGPTNISYSKSDIWIVKTDAVGQKEWDQVFSGNGYDNLRVILATDDGGFLLGGYSNSDASGDKSENSKGGYDIWLIKTDASGNKEWDKTLGGSGYDNIYELIPTRDGGYLIGGNSYSDASGGKTEDAIGRSDMWIVKITATGEVEWDQTIGSNRTDLIREIVPVKEGGYLIGGSQKHDPCDPMDFGNHYYDYWIIRISAEGSILWDKKFGLCGSDVLEAITPAGDGGFMLGGISSSDASEGEKSEDLGGASHIWVIKVDEAGNRLWDKAFLGHALSSILPTEDEGFILGGRVNLGTSSGRDFWLLKIDDAGNKLWDQTIGGDGTEEMNAMIKTADGAYLAGGYSDSDISGDKSESSRGGRDYWVVKLKEEKAPEPGPGHITGGGRFHSPAGAYEADPPADGRAIFAFSVRHKMGEEAPRGNVTFILSEGRLVFSSRNIEWLAITENQAFIRGSGRIGRQEGYHFLISIVDNGRGFRADKDHFRMIIWDQEENILYDNQREDLLYAEAGMAIQGGNITIHGQKEKKHPVFARINEELISGEQLQSVRAYPTQLNEQGLWIEFPAIEGVKRVQAAIFDVQGRRMAAKSFKSGEQEGKQLWKLDHHVWNPGVYLLIIKGEQLNYQQKLIK